MAKARKQAQIPGAERPQFAELDELIDVHQDLKDDRVKLQRKETVAKGDVEAWMKANRDKFEKNADGDPAYHWEGGASYFLARGDEKLTFKRDAQPAQETDIG